LQISGSLLDMDTGHYLAIAVFILMTLNACKAQRASSWALFNTKKNKTKTH